VPVLAQGKLAASVRLADLRSIDSKLWTDTPTSQVARPITHDETVGPDLPLFEAVAIIERSNRDFLWVVEEGKLIGIILRDDTHRFTKQKLTP
jgi:CBS domain-containing protein